MFRNFFKIIVLFIFWTKYYKVVLKFTILYVHDYFVIFINIILSPEVWKDQPYDNKSDIWSLGCVLYEIITLKPPFRSEDMEGLYKKVIRGLYPKIPSHFS